MKKNSLFEKIMNEKKKALSKYSNLHSKSEQLNLLISQLEKITFSGRNLFGSGTDCNFNEESDLDLIRPSVRMLTNELSQAKIDQNEVNRDIKTLKDKIDILNRKLMTKI